MTVTKTTPSGKSTKGAPHPSSFAALSRAMFKGFVRDKATLFFTFLFPLMFLVIFGLIFGNQGESKTRIGVVGDGPVVSALERVEALELAPIDSPAEAERQVKEGDLPAFVAEDGGTITLRFAASDQTQASTVAGIVNGVVSQANVAATGQPPRFTVDSAQVEDESLKPIQFMAPGIISWAVSIAAVFGAALTFVSWRKKQVLRRLRLAPVQPVTVLTSRVVVSLGIAVLQFALFVAVALLPVFGLRLSGQWWLAIPLLLLGTLAFFSIGMLVGAFCKTEEAASGAANLITLPMAFLSGAFFPIDAIPSWLQGISWAFPMRHLNEGILDVMVRGKGAEALLIPALVLVAFTAVVGFVAAKVFRWED
ncbi:ABC transporter [Prauserella marina]|uniref:ABC-2 type transport system permease protein n=1 Tax=Prauserella marina TaxID=530584 RepID=A0A222VV75_9PSEU|nr:ABC transporter permease [Prauserella marina]ASR37621.1 ABC transporter [Prauserella marina]PWV75534.1 ABC-2 type transport system permease protein [Prauserella marina]SDD32437.1 ABC-2 type transport system permease protein [Prauserella marina]